MGFFLLGNLESVIYANHPQMTGAVKEYIQKQCDKMTTDTLHAGTKAQNNEFITAKHSTDHILNMCGYSL